VRLNSSANKFRCAVIAKNLRPTQEAKQKMISRAVEKIANFFALDPAGYFQRERAVRFTMALPNRQARFLSSRTGSPRSSSRHAPGGPRTNAD